MRPELLPMAMPMEIAHRFYSETDVWMKLFNEFVARIGTKIAAFDDFVACFSQPFSQQASSTSVHEKLLGSVDRLQFKSKCSAAMAAIALPMLSDDVAPGDGALRTWTIPWA